MLTPAELRRRWTIELNSLGRRERPTPEQEVRKRDLQVFLSYIDPLRKHEHHWEMIKDLERKLEREMDLQNSVSNKQYLHGFYAKLLTAMTGKVHGQPSDPCELNQKAKLICEDHGERLENILITLHRENIIRKDYQNHTYSLSTIGANLMEKTSVSAITPQNTWAFKGSPLASAIKNDAMVKLAELRGNLNTENHVNNVRDMPALGRKTPLPVKNNQHKLLQNNPPKKGPDKHTIKGRILDLESRNCSGTQIFTALVGLNLITVSISEERMVGGDEWDDIAIWESTMAIEQIKGLKFTETGTSKKNARHKNHERIIKALKSFGQ